VLPAARRRPCNEPFVAASHAPPLVVDPVTSRSSSTL
jgi:hypothetical protein